MPGGEALLPLWKFVVFPRGTLSYGKEQNELGFTVVMAEVMVCVPPPTLRSTHPLRCAQVGEVATFDRLAPKMTIADGMNEAGLTVACQTQRQAVYQSSNSNGGVPSSIIYFYEVVPVLLGCCR